MAVLVTNRTSMGSDIEKAAAMAEEEPYAAAHKHKTTPYHPPECVANGQCNHRNDVFDGPLVPITLGLGVLVAGLIWLKRRKQIPPTNAPAGTPPTGAPPKQPDIDPFAKYDGYEPVTEPPPEGTALEREVAKKNGLVLGEARQVERGTYTILVSLGMRAQSKSPVQCASLKFRLVRKGIGGESMRDIAVEMRGLRIDGLIKDGDRLSMRETALKDGEVAHPREVLNHATNSTITCVPEPGEGSGGAGLAVLMLIAVAIIVFVAVAILKHR